MAVFTHLHVHTQYSILDGASNIKTLIKKVKDDGMTAIAITDHGNMFGVMEFHKEATKQGIKPIIGCEVYVARGSRHDKKGKGDYGGDHLILLAKNHVGYKNLIKIVSLGWIEGFYMKPRIDKELLFKYSEGLIVSSACLGGEVPGFIADGDLDKAEEAILQFKEVFKDDFYLELQRHQTTDPEADQKVFQLQQIVNLQLVSLAKKLDVKYIATNDVHFVNAQDAEAHDILICLNTGADIDSLTRMRYTRQEWMKTNAEMQEIFSDLPEAIINTQEIAEKIETYAIVSKPIMPDFPLPEGFEDPNEYLKHLAYEGAKKRYPIMTDEIMERLDFELGVMKNMGFPGYFLIVQDFIAEARKMGVSVGPGRGSAAGSAVAYCLRITDIDPIKYDLLFERFLNPDRISMPDIDIDFDDDGREKVLKYVTDKYGADKVAHIITFGTMAAKSAIRDVARVKKLPLSESDRLAKLVPEGPKSSLASAFKEVKELEEARNSGNTLIAEILKLAETLEGSVRNTGKHACGIIIGKDDLTNYLPISITKDDDKELLVTQYEGSFVEDVGMLKMDFLGLKTLSIIQEALENIKKSKKISIDINDIPLDDVKTYELYSKGETTGTFQFESDGMKKYLKELKPNKFEDLIAMNALYRPGPMDYIPNFINRKHGREKIVYDIPIMEERLKETYGITVYQEQVMLLSRDMAGFSRGESDQLRKAMGKKLRDVMDKLKVKFKEGCAKNNHAEDKVEKVWTDWEKFAEYAFNKSHSTCYSYVAYQTAYLKAHYPAEYMAAVLSRNISDIKKITLFMDECRRMGINVLGPDVNESELKFTVNKKGDIRFGLGAIKGVGENAVDNIVENREKGGSYTSIYNFVERVNLNAVNKKNIEGLSIAGAFDAFSEIRRSQFFAADDKGVGFVDNIIRYGNKMQSDTGASTGLFGDSIPVNVSKPAIPIAEDWSTLEQLNKERELIGIFLSAHPLDKYRFEIEHLCTHPLSEMSNLEALKGKDIIIAGLITSAEDRLTKTGKAFGSISIEDFSDSYKITLFGNDYSNFKGYFKKDYSILIRGKVQSRNYPPGSTELELKIASISHLDEARNKLLRSVTIKIPAASVDETIINEVGSFLDPKKGNVMLKFLIYDLEDNIILDMFSRTGKIFSQNNDFINFLQNNEFIEYKIN